MYVTSPTVPTHFVSVLRNVLAKKNSFQPVIKPKVAAATTPGRADGSTTRYRDPRRVQPSVSAASSSSRGTPSKNPSSIHRHSGTVNVVVAIYTMPLSVSSRCRAKQDVERDRQHGHRDDLPDEHQEPERDDGPA